MLVTPERFMSSSLITNTAAAALVSCWGFLETDVTLRFIKDSIGRFKMGRVSME
jgi:hypothetical protein